MKLICAPMATLSHCAFRIMIEKFGGCDEYYTEMINAPSLMNKGPFEKYYIDPAPVPEKLVWQLTGKSIEPFVEATQLLCELPGIGIDLNMGCSAPEILRSGAGIAWMLKPIEETEDLVCRVKKVIENYENLTGIKKRLSVKCRLGDENFTDESFFSFIDMLVSNGVSQITIHPRTRKEKYREKPRYKYVQSVAEKYDSKVSIVGNGDISDYSSFNNVINLCSNCSGLMIGRAAVQKPWIFAELKGLMKGCQIDLEKLADDFIDDVKKYQPPEFWKTRLQRFFTYYSLNFSFAHYVQSKLLNASTPEESKLVLEKYFTEVPSDKNIKFY